MASSVSYRERASRHPHPVARKLFEIAETKKSNLVISADLTDTASLLQCADTLGPYIAVFKTHIDIVADFSPRTVEGLLRLAAKHNFLIFEDRKIVDIGSTAQKQYHGGALRLSEWADVVNLSILGGEGVVRALDEVITHQGFPYRGERALLLLAEMTSEGSMAAGAYTRRCVEVVGKYPGSVIGFVAKSQLTPLKPGEADHVVFTTGINNAAAGDALGQVYQKPRDAARNGSDFVIAGRGIYGASDPVKAAKEYQEEGWQGYLERLESE
ncbi:Orotidine 5'-phosphate decarboxylase [Colletotrichum spinosum]|uniref:Orotidine 5'-phosphate decarboxylase n=1 Tax=Colletotrichum spinosum TaxID=1347390 RepID=A0A4R8Q1U9_9PEZI|nr:Orotidine 5'-phosphate decarboxylase [Colletotrichum spinosum]